MPYFVQWIPRSVLIHSQMSPERSAFEWYLLLSLFFPLLPTLLLNLGAF